MHVKRLLSGMILIAIVIGVISVDWLCALFVGLFIVIGLSEFFEMLEKKGIRAYRYFGIALGMLIPLSIALRFETSRNWELLFIVAGLFILLLLQFRRRNNSGVIVDISTTFFGIIYISWLMSFLIKIRFMPQGLWLLSALLLITKLGDIGAYLVGSKIGKHLLLPRISPKKTIEGSIGGIIFSLLGAWISQPWVGFSLGHMLVLGLALSILGQLGDLSESLIKRDCQVKDSGNILPGMGGVLDEIDSLLFTAPAFYFYLQAFYAYI